MFMAQLESAVAGIITREMTIVAEKERMGVDFITIYSGIMRKTIQQIKNYKRMLNIVSRGGCLLFTQMSMTDQENPFYGYFDDIM